MALMYTVHQCPLELYTLVDLTCQATESTPSNKHGCPFPPPGWRQGTSNPRQRICCSLAVRMTWRSPPEDQNQDQTAYLVWRAGCWKLEWHFSKRESSLVIVLPHNSRTCASRLEVGFPSPVPHVLSVVTQVKPQGALWCVASVFPLLSSEMLARNS